MKLAKAVEIITDYNYSLLGVASSDISNAQKLLIEAAQRIRVGRDNPGTRWNELLPGETET